MSIQVTIPLTVQAVLYIEMEPGEILTDEIVKDRCNSLQRHLDRYEIDAGDCTAYLAVAGYTPYGPYEAWNRDAMTYHPAWIDAPVPAPEGIHVHHDIDGWYIVNTLEAEEEEATQTSTGFDGRLHFATAAEAWAAVAAEQATK